MVTVQTKDGSEYEGLLDSGWWQDDGPNGLSLRLAKPCGLGPESMAPQPVDTKLITIDEFVSAAASSVDIYHDELTDAARRKGGEVIADSEIEIAGGRSEFGAERELVSAADWLGADAPELESDHKQVQRGWDQFAVNERLGARSTYSDELYTTKISDKKFTAAQLAAADKMAREIEGKVTTNSHVAEERGQKELDEDMDGDMDEEDKYSMVLGGRAATAASGLTTGSTPAPAPPPAPADTDDAAPSTPASEDKGAATPASVKPAVPSKLRAVAKEFVPNFKPAGGASPSAAMGMGAAHTMGPSGYHMGGMMPQNAQQASMAMHYGSPQAGGMAPGGGYMMAQQGGNYSPQQMQQMQQQQMQMQQMHMAQQQQQQQQMSRGMMGQPQSPGMMMNPSMMGQPGYAMRGGSGGMQQGGMQARPGMQQMPAGYAVMGGQGFSPPPAAYPPSQGGSS